MNNLLPRIDELFPINGNRNTFGDSRIQNNFYILTFAEKLQIFTDLVRQTMIVSEIPNPKTELFNMNGDSYTASIILIDYLKTLGIGIKYSIVLALRKPFEITNNKSNNFIVLVTDENNICYQVDCSPFLGYSHGNVKKVEDGLMYKEYYRIEGEVKLKLEAIRKVIYELSVEKEVNVDNIKYYNKVILDIKDIPFLENYYTFAKKMLEGDEKYNVDFSNYKFALIQIEIWKKELFELKLNDSNLEHKIRLSQWITAEYEFYHSENKKYAKIQNELVAFSKLTPRYFYEKKLNCVIIKPSSYIIKKEEYVKQFILKDNKCYGEYMVVLGGKSKDGINIMKIFHPDGFKYERSMLGPCEVILVNCNALQLKKLKDDVRNKLTLDMEYKIVDWYDGNPFYWEPVIANFAHSTDDSCEAACHYLSAFPEYQTMTRFMYPNPKLKY